MCSHSTIFTLKFFIAKLLCQVRWLFACPEHRLELDKRDSVMKFPSDFQNGEILLSETRMTWSSEILAGSLAAVEHSVSSTRLRFSIHRNEGSLIYRKIWQIIHYACWSLPAPVPAPVILNGSLSHLQLLNKFIIRTLTLRHVKFPPLPDVFIFPIIKLFVKYSYLYVMDWELWNCMKKIIFQIGMGENWNMGRFRNFLKTL